MNKQTLSIQQYRAGCGACRYNSARSRRPTHGVNYSNMNFSVIPYFQTAINLLRWLTIDFFLKIDRFGQDFDEELDGIFHVVGVYGFALGVDVAAGDGDAACGRAAVGNLDGAGVGGAACEDF